MSKPKNKKRDYKYLDLKELEEEKKTHPPVDDPIDLVLENALLDIIQLAEDNEMTDEEIDRVIRKIQDDRASFVRGKFTLHVRKGGKPK